MLLIGTRNATAQTVPADGIINLGTVYRKYCKKINGVPVFSFSGNALTLQASGIYQVTATITFSAPVAGNVSIALFENGVTTNATATETITTADTEFRTITLDYFVLTDSSCVLGTLATALENLTLVNTSAVVATITNVVFDVVKVV